MQDIRVNSVKYIYRLYVAQKLIKHIAVLRIRIRIRILIRRIHMFLASRRLMTKIAGSGSRSGSESSGSISQRHGSTDPDPDPHQNVMDLRHWYIDVSLHGTLYTRQRCIAHTMMMSIQWRHNWHLKKKFANSEPSWNWLLNTHHTVCTDKWWINYHFIMSSNYHVQDTYLDKCTVYTCKRTKWIPKN